MNALELADKLQTNGKGCSCAAVCAWECACDAEWAENYTSEAATMLRQQQAEIEALNRFIVERGETGQLIIWKAQEQ
jgi:ketopantoate reductase